MLRLPLPYHRAPVQLLPQLHPHLRTVPSSRSVYIDARSHHHLHPQATKPKDAGVAALEVTVCCTRSIRPSCRHVAVEASSALASAIHTSSSSPLPPCLVTYCNRS